MQRCIYMPFHHKRYMTYCTSRNKQVYQSRVQFHFGFVSTTKYIYIFFLFCVHYVYIVIMHTHTYIQKHSCTNTHLCSAVAGGVRNVSRCRYFVSLGLRYRVCMCVCVCVYVRDSFCYTNYNSYVRGTCLFSYASYNSIIHLSCNKTFGRSYIKVIESTRIDRNAFYKSL